MEKMYSLNPNLSRTVLPFRGWRCSLILASALVMGVSQSKAQPSDYYVAVGNDASQEYEVYDPTVTDWNSGSALKWTFAPSTSGGWNSSEVAAWSNPTECKLRWSGGNQVVACSASGGLVTVATYPSRTMVWAMNVGGANNPHSAEYLPNGNVAMAASAGNFVRVYAASQGNRNGTYAQFNLTGAHSVLWDPAANALWALGTSSLVKLSVGGTAASPTLSQLASYTLPETSGHDLSPNWGDSDSVWVTVSLHVYIFQKSTGNFYAAPGSSNRSAVKGCGNQPSGEIVQCQQDNSVCTLNTWCTPNVNFFTAAGASDYTRTKTGAAFYKARIFMPDYQPNLSPRLGGDFDGDGVPDAVTWDDSTGTWKVRFSNGGSVHSFQFGQNGDIPLINGDWDGDGQPDAVLFRPSNGTWYVRYSNDGSVHSFAFGQSGDTPIIGGIFGGTGQPDAVLFRPSNGTWYVRFWNDGSIHSFAFGQSGDIPMMKGDWDGDGNPDAVLFRPSNNTWYVRYSSDASVHSFGFGASGNIPFIGGVYGSGQPDAVVWDPPSGDWTVRFWNDGSLHSFQYGENGDRPLINGDFDGDGNPDSVIYRRYNRTWYVRYSSDASSHSFTY